MDRLAYRFLLFSLAVLFSSSASYCNDPSTNANKLPPPLAVPSPDAGNPAGGGETGAGRRPEPSPGTTSPGSTSSGTAVCKSVDAVGEIQRCVLSLKGYEEANYDYHVPGALESYVNTVAVHIEEANTPSCKLLSATIKGYADSQQLIKVLPWGDVPNSCLYCRKEGATSVNLSNDDLACVRQCLVKNRIYSLLEHDTEIFSNAPGGLKSDYFSFTDPSEAGEAYRRVDVILERGGQCPND